MHQNARNKYENTSKPNGKLNKCMQQTKTQNKTNEEKEKNTANAEPVHDDNLSAC